jgi:CubicO group peptidase (beta-lactamase class C family)
MKHPNMAKKYSAEILFIVFILAGMAFFSNAKFQSPPTSLPTADIQEEKKDTLLHKNLKNELSNLLHHKHRLGFNGTLLVGIDNDIIINEGLGFEDYRNRDSISNKTMYQIGSVTKQFTATAILQLYARGKLALTDSINKFFPHLPYQGFTIHQLLVHRSGLSNYVYFIDKLITDKSQLISNDDVIALWKEHEPVPYYPPGRRYDYSNSGYMLLASIIEKVSGMSYPEYMQKNIFEPLGMQNTLTYTYNKTDTLAHLAKGYNYRWNVATEAYLNGTYGDKGIYTTAEDLFKWDQGLYSNILMDTDTLKLAFRPMGKPQHYKHNYGYGWRMFERKNEKVYYHAGWWQGFKSLLIRVPKYKLTIVVLKNTKTGAMLGRQELLRVIIDHHLTKWEELSIHELPQFARCIMPDAIT